MTIMRHDPNHQHCNHVDPGRELIHVDCASHIYPDGSVGIHEMCFHVMKDEIVALCGPNGSGKSTLIEHLNGLLLPSEGDIVINGRSIARGERADLWKEVGVVFQRSEDQLFAPTVLDDVMFGPLNLGLSPEEAKAEAMKALEAVGAADLVHKLPNYLSGGQKRLVSIAGILAMKPRIIALDEPTSDLDPVHSAMIERLIIEFKRRFGISVVIATHDLELAARIADRVCLVRNGAIYAEGSPREVFYDTALIEEAGLKLPDTVMTWLEYCRGIGMVSNEQPLTRTELVTLLEKSAGNGNGKSLG
ncbi:MAG: ATP-binding cassette domain-containing protein [Methanoregula sp.]|jgi:cobalt/nickel transport system ATP-binding protein|uniref:energy-coupling factor ABC transporter ATP-binding protein n=1 Tax=Methanoregula sp. TaxID=2052170 RepID=UPI0025F46A59|nr:ATP-binding cassette domain-containing protein [Methanoregula sp.]MCK9632191.1 ATP-binding cassette domain-containing protein [Methanoregula sp.]